MMEQMQLQSRSIKDRVLSLPFILMVMLILWLVGGFSVITIFILGRSWKGVVYTALVFFGGVQLFFWYFRTKTILAQRHQIRRGFVIHPRNSGSSNYPEHDDPPTYEDILKDDPPPPAYYEVISEAFKFPFFTPSTPASPAQSIKSKPGPSHDSDIRHEKKDVEEVHGPKHKHTSKSQLEGRSEGLPNNINTNNHLTHGKPQERHEGSSNEFDTKGHSSSLPDDREPDTTPRENRCSRGFPRKHPGKPKRVRNDDQTEGQCHNNPAFQDVGTSGSQTDKCNKRCCNGTCQEKRHMKNTTAMTYVNEQRQKDENPGVTEGHQTPNRTPASTRRQKDIAQSHSRNSSIATTSRSQDPVSTIRLPILRHVNCPRKQ